MPDPTSVSLSGDVDIDALLTGFKWDETALTYSFPDSGWWYVLEQLKNELSITDLIDAVFAVASDPLGGLINLLQDMITGPAGDTIIVAAVALNDFGEFNAAQKAAAHYAIDSAAALTGLSFSEVDEGDFTVDLDPGIFDGDGLDIGFTHGLIRFALTDSTSAPAFGIPPLPRVEILLGHGFLGDTWFANDGTFDTPALGNYAHFTIMHEFGHALGLKHGHESGLFGTNIPEWLGEALTDVSGPILPADHNSIEFSIMTYRSALNGPDSLQAEKFGYAQSFMMFDIAALQYMYGADFGMNASDTTYSWDPSTGEMFVNGVGQGRPGEGATGTDAEKNRIFRTIWDGNGTDTYDMSAYMTGVKIDLEPGKWSVTSDTQRANLGSGYKAQGNVYNALLYQGDQRSMIENATGGSGGDTISGNLLGNLLLGNGGADSIAGLAGTDSIDGGADGDTLDGGDDNDTLNGAGGNDSLLGGGGDDKLDGGDDNDTILGGVGADLIDGGEGKDSLDGGDQNDTIRGQGGDDVILGGEGDDTIDAGAGNDSVLAGPGEDTVAGGDGGDTIDGGTGRSLISGDAGNDSIIAGDDNDTLTGGEDNDTILAGGGADSIDSGNGDDSVEGGAGPDSIVAGAGADVVRGGTENDTIDAGAGADDVDGGDGADSIDAGTDNDTVAGGAGNDSIAAGEGDNSVSGDAGADLIASGAGADSIDGGADADSIDSGAGNDTAAGGDGSDTIVAGAGADLVSGADGADSIDAGADNDTVFGGAGQDVIYAGIGDDSVDGGGDADLIHGGDGADVLAGGDGNDEVYGEAGIDHLYGNAGNDTLAGGPEGDTLDGGDGIDMASYIDATGPVVINLQDPTQTTGDAAGDKLISIEQFGLTNFGDTFIGLDDPLVPDVVYGRDGNDTLLGFAGNDSLYGENGDDSLVGGQGADLLDGGDGFDTTSFLESKIGIVVDLTNPSRNTGIAAGDQIVSIERFHMTIQNDEFDGLAAGEEIFAYDGNDSVFGNGGDDTAWGGTQHDLLDGGAGKDQLFGEAGNDTLRGGDDNDSLSGGLDIDSLEGGAGNDTLRGGDANDVLVGGAGDDQLWGDAGRDVFVYGASGWGKDVIFDFQDRDDRIQITGLPKGPGVQAMNDLSITQQIGGGGSVETVIRLAAGGTDEIVLVGISASQINHQDFIFQV